MLIDQHLKLSKGTPRSSQGKGIYRAWSLALSNLLELSSDGDALYLLLSKAEPLSAWAIWHLKCACYA